MKYKSTRGRINDLSFSETVLMGLADDGGLIVPHYIPVITKQQLFSLYSSSSSSSSSSFQYIMFYIMRLFIEESDISSTDLKHLIDKSTSSFDHPLVTPLVDISNDDNNNNLFILELFRGPTFAFKDVALQFLGNLFEYLLQRKKNNNNNNNNDHVVIPVKPLVVLGATSGDTGSAAIYGLRGKKNVEVFMLHPHHRVTKVQELQMTSVMDENIHNLAVTNASFDDCQNIVKSLFNDLEFKQQYRLSAVNSINWARILAQITYYFHAYFQLLKNNHSFSVPLSDKGVVFSVPTGNFGDILAGYYAKRMGLPISKLIIASNENDILDRLFTNGEYKTSNVVPTCSPSMDIQISSNLERYLYYTANEDSDVVRGWMTDFEKYKGILFPSSWITTAGNDMWSARVNQSQTLETISQFRNDKPHNYLLDPHTAIGVKAGLMYREFSKNNDIPLICLATAHPAKFSDTIVQATGSLPPFPPALERLLMDSVPTRCDLISPSAANIKSYIVNTLSHSATANNNNSKL